MLTTRELFTRLRQHFIIENEKEDNVLHAFDKAVNETLFGMVDGQSATPAKTRKPRGPNKKRKDQNASEPSGEAQ